jgi:hypothetical protein
MQCSSQVYDKLAHFVVYDEQANYATRYLCVAFVGPVLMRLHNYIKTQMKLRQTSTPKLIQNGDEEKLKHVCKHLRRVKRNGRDQLSITVIHSIIRSSDQNCVGKVSVDRSCYFLLALQQ